MVVYIIITPMLHDDVLKGYICLCLVDHIAKCVEKYECQILQYNTGCNSVFCQKSPDFY